MSYNQPSSYPGAPQQNQQQYQQGYQPNGGQNYNNQGSASSFYDNNNAPQQQYGGQGGPQQYDERGNPIPADGERGLGTMAMGAVGGVAANKLSGDQHSSFKSGIAGALLAQGAKMAYEHFDKNKKHEQQGQYGGQYGSPYGGPPQQNQSSGFGGLFGGKREA